jgi:hypothetical protein
LNITKGLAPRSGVLIAVLAAAMVMAGNADAIVINFSGISSASGNPLSARAEILVSGTQLTIILTNTATSAATNGADVLDGLYFDIAGANPVFSNGNATLSAGSSFVHKNNVPTSGHPLNNEWMFKSSIGSPINREYGLGGTGFPSFNTNDDTLAEVFHNINASASANSDYGMVPTAGITVGNSSNVYVNRSITYTFDLSFAISENDIRNPLVSYGSGGETELTPEPASLAIITIGLLVWRRPRRRARRVP